MQNIENTAAEIDAINANIRALWDEVAAMNDRLEDESLSDAAFDALVAEKEAKKASIHAAECRRAALVQQMNDALTADQAAMR